MGQIKLESDVNLECTCEDGTKCEGVLSGAKNHPVEKLINTSEGKCDVVLSSGKTFHGLDKSLFVKLGKITEEQSSKQEPNTTPFYKFS